MNKEKGRVVYPAASFQPPDSCPECLAGVPFDEQGQHAQPAETPWEDLRVRALQDYEDKATATHSWSSVIPQAINFYFDNFRRLSAAPITQDSASASALSQDVPDESSVLRLYNLLKEYGQHKKGCTVETTDCICGFSSKISKLVPPSESESTLVTAPDVQAAELRKALQAAFDFYMDMPRACGDFTCMCGNTEHCGICAIRESTRAVLAASPVQVDEVSKALEELKAMFPGGAYLRVRGGGTWFSETEKPDRHAVVYVNNLYFDGTTLSEAIAKVREWHNEVSKEQDNAKS